MAVIEKQRATDDKVSELLEHQRAMDEWRKNIADPEIQTLKASIRRLSAEISMGQNNESDPGSLKPAIAEINSKIGFLTREVAVLKERLRDRTRTIAHTINAQHTEMQSDVQRVAEDMAPCRTSIVELERFSRDIVKRGEETASELSDLWDLAHKTSVDLQAAERRSAKAALDGTTFLTQMSKPTPRRPSSERVARFQQKSIMLQPSAHARLRRAAQMKRQQRPKSAAAARRPCRAFYQRPNSVSQGEEAGLANRPLTNWGTKGWKNSTRTDLRLE